MYLRGYWLVNEPVSPRVSQAVESRKAVGLEVDRCGSGAVHDGLLPALLDFSGWPLGSARLHLLSRSL
jgi:hypothetical protein